MTTKIIASAVAIALSAALSVCLTAPHWNTAEAQTLAATAAPAPPTPDKMRASLDGAPAVTGKRVDCDILVRRTGNGVSVAPVATAERSITGDYHLVLSKIGASGSSDVTQGGPFSALAGETVKLGETEFSLGRRDQYRVVLTITDGDLKVCRREVRS